MFKKSLITLTVVGALSTQAYANEVNYQRPQFTQADLNLIFEDADQPMQLAVLSQREMMETEGAFFPILVVGINALSGGAIGAASYAIETSFSGSKVNGRDLVASAIGGAIGGAILGPVGGRIGGAIGPRYGGTAIGSVLGEAIGGSAVTGLIKRYY